MIIKEIIIIMRIAKSLGLNKILDLSNKLDIYDDISDLSVLSAETSSINLTTAYASFINGGKQIKPNLISRIQDRRGKTIFKITKIKDV